MMSRPKVGQAVQVWYAVKPRRKGAPIPADVMPLHGRIGTIRAVARGRGPRNHCIEFADGSTCIVPAGNLRPPQAGG